MERLLQTAPFLVLQEFSITEVIPLVAGFNYAATDFVPGIPGGLRGEIISAPMDDNGFAQNLSDGQSGIVEAHPCVAIVAQKWWHISGMGRMESRSGIVMTTGAVEGQGAVPNLMNVHGVKMGGGLLRIRKPEDFGVYDNSTNGSSIKANDTAQLRMRRISHDPGDCLRSILPQESDKLWRIDFHDKPFCFNVFLKREKSFLNFSKRIV